MSENKLSILDIVTIFKDKDFPTNDGKGLVWIVEACAKEDYFSVIYRLLGELSALAEKYKEDAVKMQQIVGDSQQLVKNMSKEILTLAKNEKVIDSAFPEIVKLVDFIRQIKGESSAKSADLRNYQLEHSNTNTQLINKVNILESENKRLDSENKSLKLKK